MQLKSFPSTRPGVLVMLLVLVIVLVVHGPGWAEDPPKAEKPAKRFDPTSPLRSDPAFQVKLTVNFKRPKAQQIIDRLCKETRADLMLADNIDRQRPALGGLSCRNVPAWVILEELAKSKIIQGKWERLGNGYLLTSPLPPVELAKTSPPSPVGPAKLGLQYFLYALPILALFAIVLLIRRRRKRLHPTGSISS